MIWDFIGQPKIKVCTYFLNLYTHIYIYIYLFMLQACSVPDFDGVVKDLLVSHQMIGCMGVGPAIFFPYIYIHTQTKGNHHYTTLCLYSDRWLYIYL